MTVLLRDVKLSVSNRPGREPTTMAESKPRILKGEPRLDWIGPGNEDTTNIALERVKEGGRVARKARLMPRRYKYWHS